MIDKKEIANALEIELRTLYNWEKKRPKLYNFIIENFYKENEKTSKSDELKKYFLKLSEQEQEYFLAKIKIKVLEKELANEWSNICSFIRDSIFAKRELEKQEKNKKKGEVKNNKYRRIYKKLNA